MVVRRDDFKMFIGLFNIGNCFCSFVCYNCLWCVRCISWNGEIDRVCDYSFDSFFVCFEDCVVLFLVCFIDSEGFCCFWFCVGWIVVCSFYFWFWWMFCWYLFDFCGNWYWWNKFVYIDCKRIGRNCFVFVFSGYWDWGSVRSCFVCW